MDDLERKVNKLRKLVGSQDKKPIAVEPDRNPNCLFIAILFAVLLVLASVAGRTWLRPFALTLDSGQAIRPAPPSPEVEVNTSPDWRGYLRAGDASQRRKALAYFAQHEREIDPEVVDAAIAGLKDETLVRVAAITLQKAGFSAYAAVEPLVEIVETSSGSVQLAAFVALLTIDPIRVTEMEFDTAPLLLHALDSNDPWASRYAAHCLSIGYVKTPEVVKGLAVAAMSNSAARFALYKLGPDVAVPEILAQLRAERPGSNEPNPNLPNGAAPNERDPIRADRTLANYELWALAQDADAARPAAYCIAKSFKESPIAAYTLIQLGPSAAPYLEEARDGDFELSEAIKFVVEAWGEKAVPAFIEALRNGDGSQKYTAAACLHHLGPQAAPAIEVLVEALADEDVFLRQRVLQALRAIGPPAATAVPTLLELAKSEQHPTMLREIAATIYSISPTDEHHQRYWALIEVALQADKYTREHSEAADLLRRVPPYHLKSLFQLLENSTDSLLQVQLVDVLREHRDSAMVTRLAELLRHPRGDVRRCAAQIAEAYGPAAKVTTPDLNEMLTNSEVRGEFRAAAQALASVACDEQAAPALEELFVVRDPGNPAGIVDYAIRSIGSRASPAIDADWGKWRSITPSLATAREIGFREPRDLDDSVIPVPFGNVAEFDRSLPPWLEGLDFKLRWEREDTLQMIIAKGPAARCAVPLLHSIVAEFQGDEYEKDMALNAIWKITRSPLVVNMMIEHGVVPLETMQELPSRSVADMVPFLIRNGSFDAWVALPRAGDAAHAALPQLRFAIQHHHEKKQVAVAGLSAWRIEQDPDIIQDLVANLRRIESFDADREFIAWALGRIGPPAAPAVPRLARATFEERGQIAVAAANAIELIQTDALAKWRITPAPR